MMFHPILRDKPALLEQGIKIIDNDEEGEFDIAFISARGYLDDFNKTIKKFKLEKKPIVIMDSQDSPRLASFHLTERDNVVGFVKKQVYKDREVYKHIHSNPRYHFSDNPSKNFKINKKFKGDLNKLYLGWNLGMANRFHVFRGKIPIRKKTLDVHYSGSIWNNLQEYQQHRKRCRDEIIKATRKNNWSFSGHCSGKKYKEKMKIAKVGISPWGLGEICFRNFEMIKEGVIVIAPKTNHLETWPDIYQDGINYISCSSNFSDIEDKIKMILNKYSDFKPVAENAFNLMNVCWKTESVISQFMKILNGVRKRI